MGTASSSTTTYENADRRTGRSLSSHIKLPPCGWCQYGQRCYACRRQYREKLISAAAIRIQSVVRAFFCRKHVRVECNRRQASALKIQNVVRIFLSRQSCQRKTYQLVATQPTQSCAQPRTSSSAGRNSWRRRQYIISEEVSAMHQKPAEDEPMEQSLEMFAESHAEPPVGPRVDEPPASPSVEPSVEPPFDEPLDEPAVDEPPVKPPADPHAQQSVDPISNRFLTPPKTALQRSEAAAKIWKSRHAETTEAFERSLIIFDWDDTLLPTTWLQKQANSIHDILNTSLRQRLESHAFHAAEALSVAQRFGRIVIITNAAEGWVESSCRALMPSLWPLVRSIPITSARSRYGHFRLEDWKYFAFLQELAVLRKFRGDTRTLRMLSVGDMHFEKHALERVAQESMGCLATSVKFQEEPELLQLESQLAELSTIFPYVIRNVFNPKCVPCVFFKSTSNRTSCTIDAWNHPLE